MTDTKPSEREAFECHKVNQRMAGLLSRIAAAIKGDPGPHRMHSWHDLPDLAAQAMQAARATQSAQHPDDLAVDRFAAAMKEKMALARAKGRGGWNDPAQCSVERLATMLVEHIAKGDPVDVANFAMMLHQRGAGLEVLAQQSLQQEQDRIDAERYRWLRDNRESDWTICLWDGFEYIRGGLTPEIIDAGIDAARKGGSNG